MRTLSSSTSKLLDNRDIRDSLRKVRDRLDETETTDPTEEEPDTVTVNGKTYEIRLVSPSS